MTEWKTETAENRSNFRIKTNQSKITKFSDEKRHHPLFSKHVLTVHFSFYLFLFFLFLSVLTLKNK